MKYLVLLLLSCSPNPNVNNQLVDICLSWLQHMDNKNYGQSWNESSSALREVIAKKQWQSSNELAHQQLGKLLRRKYYTSSSSGDRAEVIFKSDFQNLPESRESLHLMKIANKWKIIGYFIK